MDSDSADSIELPKSETADNLSHKQSSSSTKLTVETVESSQAKKYNARDKFSSKISRHKNYKQEICQDEEMKQNLNNLKMKNEKRNCTSVSGGREYPSWLQINEEKDRISQDDNEKDGIFRNDDKKDEAYENDAQKNEIWENHDIKGKDYKKNKIYQDDDNNKYKIYGSDGREESYYAKISNGSPKKRETMLQSSKLSKKRENNVKHVESSKKLKSNDYEKNTKENEKRDAYKKFRNETCNKGNIKKSNNEKEVGIHHHKKMKLSKLLSSSNQETQGAKKSSFNPSLKKADPSSQSLIKKKGNEKALNKNDRQMATECSRKTSKCNVLKNKEEDKIVQRIEAVEPNKLREDKMDVAEPKTKTVEDKNEQSSDECPNYASYLECSNQEQIPQKTSKITKLNISCKARNPRQRELDTSRKINLRPSYPDLPMILPTKFGIENKTNTPNAPKTSNKLPATDSQSTGLQKDDSEKFHPKEVVSNSDGKNTGPSTSQDSSPEKTNLKFFPSSNRYLANKNWKIGKTNEKVISEIFKSSSENELDKMKPTKDSNSPETCNDKPSTTRECSRKEGVWHPPATKGKSRPKTISYKIANSAMHLKLTLVKDDSTKLPQMNADNGREMPFKKVEYRQSGNSPTFNQILSEEVSDNLEKKGVVDSECTTRNIVKSPEANKERTEEKQKAANTSFSLDNVFDNIISAVNKNENESFKPTEEGLNTDSPKEDAKAARSHTSSKSSSVLDIIDLTVDSDSETPKHSAIQVGVNQIRRRYVDPSQFQVKNDRVTTFDYPGSGGCIDHPQIKEHHCQLTSKKTQKEVSVNSAIDVYKGSLTEQQVVDVIDEFLQIPDILRLFFGYTQAQKMSFAKSIAFSLRGDEYTQGDLEYVSYVINKVLLKRISSAGSIQENLRPASQLQALSAHVDAAESSSLQSSAINSNLVERATNSFTKENNDLPRINANRQATSCQEIPNESTVSASRENFARCSAMNTTSERAPDIQDSYALQRWSEMTQAYDTSTRPYLHTMRGNGQNVLPSSSSSALHWRASQPNIQLGHSAYESNASPNNNQYNTGMTPMPALNNLQQYPHPYMHANFNTMGPGNFFPMSSNYNDNFMRHLADNTGQYRSVHGEPSSYGWPTSQNNFQQESVFRGQAHCSSYVMPQVGFDAGPIMFSNIGHSVPIIAPLLQPTTQVTNFRRGAHVRGRRTRSRRRVKKS